LNLRVSTRRARGDLATMPWALGVYSGVEDVNVGADAAGSRDRLIGAVDALGFWLRPLTDAESLFLWNDGNGWEPPVPAAP
jgi:hypothetical protein